MRSESNIILNLIQFGGKPMKNRFYLNTFYDDSHKLNVEKWLSSKQKIVASLAPSYLAEFDTDPHKVAGALRKLGIFEVEETVTVLPQIAESRQKLVDNSSKPIIFSSCPVIRKIIEDNFPNLKRFLCCLPSPMVLHGQILKQKFPQSKVVFIGPCFAKQKEEVWFYKKQTIDAVITFKDLRSLLKKTI
jgi:iron only hydrogenase large subunit-like protein